MGVAGAEQSLCACYNKECQEFHKVVELKDTGLVVYCYDTSKEDATQGEVVGTRRSASQDVFVLQNTKDVHITSSEIKPVLEKHQISCPRCRKTFEHAQELLQKVTSIGRKNIMGICDHCRQKVQTMKKPCYYCNEIVKKFISTKSEEKEDTKKCIKIWLSKMNHVFKDTNRIKHVISTDKQTAKSRSYSELQIKQLFLMSPEAKREPEVKPMFQLETHKSETNLSSLKAHREKQDQILGYHGWSRDVKEAMKKKHDLSLRHMMKAEKETGAPYTVSLRPQFYEIPKIAPWELKEMLKKQEPQIKDKVETKQDVRSEYDPSLNHIMTLETQSRDLYFVPRKPIKIVSAKPSQKDIQESKRSEDDISEKIKKDDLNLKQMRLESKSRDLDSVSHKSIKAVKSRTSQKDLTETRLKKDHIIHKHYESLMNVKGATKQKNDLNLKNIIGSDKRISEPFSEQYRVEKYEHGRIKKAMYDSEQIPKKVKKPEEKYFTDEELKFTKSVPQFSHATEKPGQREIKTNIQSKELIEHEADVVNILKKQFSYYFPKSMEKEPKKLDAHSSTIIRSTQEKIRQEAEDKRKEEKKRKEEERQKKLEEDEKKKNAREERRRLAEEKRQAEEQIKYTEGQKIFPKSKKSFEDLESRKKRDEDDEKKSKMRVESGESKKDLTEKNRKDLKAKGEQKDENEIVSDKAKRYSKEVTDKKDLKAKSKQERDNIDELMEKAKTEAGKEKKRQKEQEDKDRRAQEKESGSTKKLDSLKEADQQSKTKKETSKEKEAASKKSTDLSKEKGVSRQQEELSKEKQEPSTDIEVPLSSTEPKDLSTKQQDIPKEKKDLEASKRAKEEEAQFKKLQAELHKEKAEALKKKKQQEAEAQKLKEMAEKKAKEEDEKKMKKGETKAVIKSSTNKQPPEKSPKKEKEKEEEKLTNKELEMRGMKIRNTSSDDLILRLVRIRQSAGTKNQPRNIDLNKLINFHKCRHQSGLTFSACELCQYSDLEIDAESYDNKLKTKGEQSEIIIGEKIFKYKPPLVEITEKPEVVPILFQSVFKEELAPLPSKEILQIIPPETEPVKKQILATNLSTKDPKGIEPESGRGIIHYALSDRTFIDKGWTMLPTEKVVRKMNVYRMRPAHPEFDWFEHNKNKRLMTYDTSEKLAEFDDNGRGRWYYRNGRLALDYYDAEETNAQQRFVIYSSGEPDERGRSHPITILATFDYLGNGIVFDHAGKIRLKYNQTEGVVLDRGIGPVSHWKWHTLNDPPVLQQVMIDTQMAHKDPQIIKFGSPADRKTRADNEEMLAIEFDNFIKEKSKKLSQKFKPFQIRMKALKINEHFSLKVLDQATIYLIFRDGSTNLKLNIGMILDHQEIVDTDTAEVGEVSNNLERFPARTDSLAGLQNSVAYAQRYERQRTERERRLRRPEPCVSADQLTAAASSPLRPPLRTMPPGSTTSNGDCNCRKPANNLYYNTRLL